MRFSDLWPKIQNLSALRDLSPRPGGANALVRVNIERNTDLDVLSGTVRERFRNLRPGERAEILYEISEKTKQVVVDLTNVVPELPPDQQNALFWDDIFINIHSAQTSSDPYTPGGDYVASGFTFGDTFVINDPEPGIMRITIMGDMTNAGRISADVMVTSSREPSPGFTAQGRLREGQIDVVSVKLPSANVAEFRLEWNEHWGKYPTNDLDLWVEDPNGVVERLVGSTLSSPEVIRISNPTPGIWKFYMIGFGIPKGADRWELRVTADGKLVK
jgi:hypothetical protein